MTTSLQLTLAMAPNPLTTAVVPPPDLHLVKEACSNHTKTGHYLTPVTFQKQRSTFSFVFFKNQKNPFVSMLGHQWGDIFCLILTDRHFVLKSCGENYCVKIQNAPLLIWVM